MTAHGASTASLQLPPEPASVPLARRHTAAVLEQHDLDIDGDSAILVVSELVTNAVRHAATDLELRVLAEVGLLRVEVEDGSRLLPAAGKPGPFDAGGRGLPLVEALADRWGAEATPTGKLVWAELRPTSPE